MPGDRGGDGALAICFNDDAILGKLLLDQNNALSPLDHEVAAWFIVGMMLNNHHGELA